MAQDFAINDWADAGGLSAIAATVVAIGAAFIALWQYFGQSRLTRETRAIQSYDEYLRLCVAHPELSSGAAFHKRYGRDANTDFNTNAPEDEQYLWFLSVMLNAAEQIVLNTPRHHAWAKTIAAQVTYHSIALAKVWPAWREHYSESLVSVVDEALK